MASNNHKNTKNIPERNGKVKTLVGRSPGDDDRLYHAIPSDGRRHAPQIDGLVGHHLPGVTAYQFSKTGHS